MAALRRTRPTSSLSDQSSSSPGEPEGKGDAEGEDYQYTRTHKHTLTQAEKELIITSAVYEQHDGQPPPCLERRGGCA